MNADPKDPPEPTPAVAEAKSADPPELTVKEPAELAKVEVAEPAPKAGALAKAEWPNLGPKPTVALAQPLGGKTGLEFADQAGFQGTALYAVLGGASGALVAHLIERVFGGGGSIGFFIALATSGALAATGARVGGWVRAGIGAAFGIAGAVLNSLSTPEWPLLGALLLGAAAAPVLARGEPPARMAATGAFTGLFAFAGIYVASVLLRTPFLGMLLPGPLAAAAAGGAFGLFLGLGSTPKHLRPAEEPVEKAYAQALRGAQGELKEILERALLIYRAIRVDLSARAAGKMELELGKRVSDLSLRILRITEQTTGIERDLGTAPAAELEDRILGLKKKAEATSDDAAKKTLLSTVDSLESQKQAVLAIGRGLERVVARLHANVALLEKVRFSLVHAKSADAERSHGEASPLTETIEELSRELDLTSSAVGEVYGKS
ncbi:MAG: hypothetical protein U1E65_33100 [Myxococcota bacterium]